MSTAAPEFDAGQSTAPEFPAPEADAPLRQSQLVVWSLVSLIGTMMMIPLNAVIPAFYAKNTAVTLGDIALVLLLARLYDAVADPVVGFLSDRTRGPWGRRKPWVLAGGLLAALSTWRLFNPQSTATVFYFGPILFLFYTAYSMLTVPHSAWGSELTTSYAKRSYISGLLTFTGVVGLLIFMGLPVLLSSPWIRMFPSAEVTPPMMRLMGWIVIVAAPVCTLLPCLLTPRGEVKAAQVERVRLSVLARSVAANPPLWTFLAGYAVNGLAYGVYYATTYLFVDAYMGMAALFPLLYATAAVAQLVSIPLWTQLAERFERHVIWAAGIAGFGLLLTLRLLIPPGPWAFPLLIVVTGVSSAANAASQVPQMAVLADCIDFGTLKTGTNLAGSYYALQSFVLKATLAAGGSIAFWALSLAGFDPKSAHGAAKGLQSLGAIHTFLPLALFGIAGAVLMRFPITRARQGEIRAALDARTAAEPASSPA